MNIVNPILIILDKKINDLKKGTLIAVEDYDFNIEIKRVFFIYDFDEDYTKNIRGGHGHFDANEILINVNGYVEIETENNNYKNTFILDSPEKALFFPKNNKLVMKNFSKDSILLVLCDKNFKDDKVYN